MSVDFAITSKKPTVAAAAVVVVVAVFVVVVIVFVAAAASSSSSSSSLSLSRAAVQHGMDACTMSVPAWMLAPCGWIMAQGIKLAQISSHGMDATTKWRAYMVVVANRFVHMHDKMSDQRIGYYLQCCALYVFCKNVNADFAITSSEPSSSL